MRSFRTSGRGRTRLGVGAAAAVVAIATTACAVATASAQAPRSPQSQSTGQGRGLIVPTAGGAVQGATAGGTDEYLGIPYAAPPVGALRWQPPQPAASWRGVRQATSFAPHCAQPASPFGVASTSEDCLYLNVFAPPGAHARNLPVMVWIHGGALVVGESNDDNPAALVRRGVIVVTINYRLGLFGFLADAALARRPGGPSGNYGLMDQQAALRWVQRNIHGFGGNPRDVTVFGESAGGLSTLSQLVSPGARGLFARAIVQSGTYNLTQTPLATAESAGAALAAQVGCASNAAACLRSVPTSTLLAKESAAGYTPNVDGAVLPQSIGPALASGQFSHVPVMIGTNHDEWRLFVALDQLIGGPPVSADNYQTEINDTLGGGLSAAAVAAIAAQYPLSDYSSPSVALGAVGTDAIFACHALTAEQSLASYVPTYAYEFNDSSAPERFLGSVGFPYGAAHASELQYLFTLSNTAFPGTLTTSQQQLAAAMQQEWTNLAAAGAPGGGWPRFSPASPQWLSLVPSRPQHETNFAAEHHCAFWAAAG